MGDFSLQNNTNMQDDIDPILAKGDVRQTVSVLLDRFTSISLQEMDSVKLMNRIDTKYLIDSLQLFRLLQMAKEQYYVVEIDNQRISPYSTIYFDTENTEMYMMHHNRKLNRFKVRMRTYVSSGVSFLEIKRKNNKGRTSKKRVPILPDSFENKCIADSEQSFLSQKSPYNTTVLKPQLQNSFHRITLVDKNLSERVTLDIDLKYKNLCSDTSKGIDGLVIVEMKQDGACTSHFANYLKKLKVSAGSMSKYCLGMILVNPDIKNNRFKTKLRKINKITDKYYATI